MKEKNEIDILIPVFNEDETIVKTLKNILAVVKCNYKILICYDYDKDPTLKIIKDSFPNNEKILFVKNFSSQLLRLDLHHNHNIQEFYNYIV